MESPPIPILKTTVVLNTNDLLSENIRLKLELEEAKEKIKELTNILFTMRNLSDVMLSTVQQAKSEFKLW